MLGAAFLLQLRKILPTFSHHLTISPLPPIPPPHISHLSISYTNPRPHQPSVEARPFCDFFSGLFLFCTKHLGNRWQISEINHCYGVWTLGSCRWEEWISGFKFSLLDRTEVQAGVRRVRRHQLCLGLYFLRGPKLRQIYQGPRPLTQGRDQHTHLLSCQICTAITLIYNIR